MPEPLGHHFAQTKNQVTHADALRLLKLEAITLAVIASDFLQAREIDAATWQRLAQCSARLNEIASVARE